MNWELGKKGGKKRVWFNIFGLLFFSAEKKKKKKSYKGLEPTIRRSQTQRHSSLPQRSWLSSMVQFTVHDAKTNSTVLSTRWRKTSSAAIFGCAYSFSRWNWNPISHDLLKSMAEQSFHPFLKGILRLLSWFNRWKWIHDITQLCW